MPEHSLGLLDLPRGSHAVLLTSRSNFNYEPIAEFVAAGLAAGERCLVLTGDGRFAERFSHWFQQVRERGALDLKPLYEYVAREQFGFRASDGFYLREGTFRSDVVIRQWRHLLAEARAAGHRGLRVVGEVGWLWHSVNLRGFLRYEDELSQRLPDGDFTALCVYFAEDLKPVDLEQLIQSHTDGFFQTREGLVRPPAGKRLLSVLHSSLINTARLVEANRQITFLGQLAGAISYKHEPSEIARTSVDLLVRYLEARAGFLMEIDFASGAVGEVATVGLEPAEVGNIRALEPPELGRTRCYQAAVNGLPLIQSRSDCPLCDRFFRCDDGLCLVIPVKHLQKRIGALVIVCENTADLANLGADWLLAVGDTIGTAYEYQKQHRRWIQENSRAEKMRSLGILTSGIAHDFNNLLAVIIGNLQLAREKTTDRFLQANLEQAYTAARDASALVRRVQEFYRPAAREFRLVSVSELVRDAVTLTRNRWHNAALAEGVHIEIVQDLRSAAFVSGAASALRDALVNILINAFDAVNGRGGTVTIRTWDTGSSINVSVSDDGCGIPPEALPYVFDPFFTTKGERGSGLGLGITHNIITAHGGSIGVQSTPGQGTTFDIVLPAAQPEPQAPEESGRPPEFHNYAEVLLIDDEPVVLDTLKGLLSALGCRVQAAAGGYEALELLEHNRFDAVFCDLAMPGLNGLEVGVRVKSAYPDLPFVLVTGWVDPALDEVMKESVDLVLRKPVMLSDLRGALQRVVRLPASDRVKNRPGRDRRAGRARPE
ncbi:MAG: MEDS domain-containing protein [Bacillota bacterium]